MVILYQIYVLCFFFFFKQKTAYEMRISDWSSDVCSSDLHDGVEHRCVEGGGHDHAAFLEQASRLGGVLPPHDVVTDGSELGEGPRQTGLGAQQAVDLVAGHAAGQQRPLKEIGQEARRERGCQSV